MECDQGCRPFPAKMTPPRAERTFVRATTLAAIERGRRRRLTLVCAPAGYGKTTTVAACHALTDPGRIWYKLDALDRDPLRFLSSLSAAFHRSSHDFGEPIRDYLRFGQDHPRSVDQILTLICEECLLRMTRDTYLIFDDYHEAADSDEFNRALDLLINRLPNNIHLTVITRYRKSFSVEKLRLEDNLTVVGEECLRFDESQVTSLLHTHTGRIFPRDHIDRLLRVTEGWPAAVVLASHTLEWSELSSVDDALTDPRIKNDIYSYLAEQVYNSQPKDVRTFLDNTCCLTRICEKSANLVANISDSYKYIDYLHTNNIFINNESLGIFRYHNLFRDFLRQHYLRIHGEEQLRALQTESAEALAVIGETGMAVELLLNANEPRAALEMIARAGEPGLDSIGTDSLEAWLHRLPWLLRIEHPWAHLVSAQIHIRRGRLGDASIAADCATATFETSGDEWGLYHALSAKECTLFWQGDTEAAMQTCELALAHAQTNAQRFHTLLSIGSAAVDSRDWKTARGAFEASRGFAAEAPLHERVRAHALQALEAYLRGDYLRADSFCSQSLPQLDSPMLSAGVLNVMGLIAMGLAQYETAFMRLSKAKEIADTCGLRLASRMIDDNSAILLGATGRIDEALTLVRRTLAMESNDGADPVISAYGYGAQATILRHYGNLADAIESYLKASTLVSVGRDPYVALDLSANLAFTQALAGDGDGRELPVISRDASRRGLGLVSLAADLYRAILLVPSQEALAGEILSTTIPRQLRLGHFDLLAQELGPRPTAAALALASMPSGDLQNALLATLAQHWQFADICAVLLDQGSPVLTQTLKTSRGSKQGDLEAAVALSIHEHETPRIETESFEVLEATWPEGQRVSTDAATRFLSLSKRETDVLRLMASGLRNPEIASALFVSNATVKTHVNRIFSKLEVRSRVEAVLTYREHAAARRGS